MKSADARAGMRHGMMAVSAVVLVSICFVAGCAKPAAEIVRSPEEVAQDYVVGVVEGNATKVGEATGRTWLDEEVTDERVRLFGLEEKSVVTSLTASLGPQSEMSRSEQREEYVLCRVMTEPVSSFETSRDAVFVSVRLRLTRGDWRVVEVPTPSMIQ